MAKANFIEIAKKPIYKRGKRIEYVSKRGKRAGQTLSKIDRNQPANENDESEKDGMSQEEWERQEEDEKEEWIADKIGEINDAGLDFE